MKVSMKQALDLFLLSKEAICTLKTMEYYKSSLGYFMEFVRTELQLPLEEIAIDSITLPFLNKYVVYLRNKPRFLNHPFKNKENEDNRKLKNTSVRTYQRAVRIFIRYCYDEDYLDQDISKRFKLIKEDSEIILPLYDNEVTQIDALFKSVSVTSIRNLSIIHLMLDAGLRSGEVINLKIKDVYFDKGLIKVTGKGNKTRLVPLGSKLKAYLYKYLVIYRGVGINQQGYATNYKDDHVFLSLKSNAVINGNTIKTMFSRIRRNTEIYRVHAHLFRHTFATSFILGGGNLESLRIYLGHADIGTTQRYLHLANTYRLMDSDVYKLDRVFFKTFYSYYKDKE